MNYRSPENIGISNLCANCQKRVWQKNEERRGDRRYFAPKWFRQMFEETFDNYPLGSYRLSRCEVCGKTMAIFDESRRNFLDQVVILYACSLLSLPLPPEGELSCASIKSCYGCPLKKGVSYVKRQ